MAFIPKESFCIRSNSRRTGTQNASCSKITSAAPMGNMTSSINVVKNLRIGLPLLPKAPSFPASGQVNPSLALA